MANDLAFFRYGWLFLIVGAAVLSWKRWRRALSITDNPGLICLGFFLVNYLFILAVMKVNWDRYYLPSVLASSLVVAFGIYAVAYQLCRLYPVVKRRLSPQTAIQH